jgi:hypothetical protein
MKNTSQIILDRFKDVSDIINIWDINNWIANYKGSIFLKQNMSIEDAYEKYLSLKRDQIKPIIVPTIHPNWDRYEQSAHQLQSLLNKINERINVVCHIDENIGYLSGYIEGRTGYQDRYIPNDTRDIINTLFHKSNNDKYKLFLSQHRQFFNNSEQYNIVNMPIGFDKNHVDPKLILSKVKEHSDFKRDKLITSHNSLTPHRQKLFDNINNHSDIQILNTNLWQDDYYKSLSSSKYSLVMGGCGFDCFRVYEILMFGCIPIIESLNDAHGMKTFYEQFPILLVEDYNKGFPSEELLNNSYLELCEKFKTFNKDLLTTSYWINEFVN